MSEYVWSDHRDRLIEASGDSPSAELEQRILDVFQRQPALVVTGIEHIIGRYQRGLIRSPWVVLAKHVEESAAASERAAVTATDESERQRKVKQTRQWMHATGLHFDRESEVEDELFGDYGLLRQWRSDEPLVVEMLALWRQLRPAGEEIERHAEEYARQRLDALERAVDAMQSEPAMPIGELLRDVEPRVRANPFLDESPS